MTLELKHDQDVVKMYHQFLGQGIQMLQSAQTDSTKTLPYPRTRELI